MKTYLQLLFFVTLFDIPLAQWPECESLLKMVITLSTRQWPECESLLNIVITLSTRRRPYAVLTSCVVLLVSIGDREGSLY